MIRLEIKKNTELLPSDEKKVIEKAKFIYSPLGKALKKQIKATEDQGKISWSLALKALKSK